MTDDHDMLVIAYHRQSRRARRLEIILALVLCAGCVIGTAHLAGPVARGVVFLTGGR